MKFSQFSSILCDFPDFSGLVKIPWLFPDWKIPCHFPGFPVRVGTLIENDVIDNHLSFIPNFKQ